MFIFFNIFLYFFILSSERTKKKKEKEYKTKTTPFRLFFLPSSRPVATSTLYLIRWIPYARSRLCNPGNNDEFVEST